MSSNVITKEEFGKTSSGELVERFTLSNKNRLQLQIISYGGAMTSLRVPDKHGILDDVVTGYDTLTEYEENAPYFGVLVGRIANRIAGGKFVLDGQSYQLAVNNGPNHLHGGPTGFQKRVWKSSIEGSRVRLTYVSADGEEGYPGELHVSATYELTDDNEVVIDLSATTTKPTIVNLTSHTYFNLAGHKSGDVYNHLMSVNADKFTPKDENNIPTGEIASVTGTQFDLRTPVLIGERIHKIPKPEAELPGFDHNFCLQGNTNEKKLAVRLEHEGSGRVLECSTSQPGVQVYSANYVDNQPGKGGAIYGQHCAVAIETQNYPDAVNHVNFPSCVLRPGETYNQTTWYKFSVK